MGFAGAEVDRLAETKGMDWLDRERAKRQAQDQACQMYDQQYGGYDNYDPYVPTALLSLPICLCLVLQLLTRLCYDIETSTPCMTRCRDMAAATKLREYYGSPSG